MNNLTDKIKSALANGDKTLGEIKDETGADYPALRQPISILIAEGEVEVFWSDGATPALCYRLKKKILLAPFFGRY